MGLFSIFGICIAFLFVPSLAHASKAVGHTTPTTPYYSVTKNSVRTPSNSTVVSVPSNPVIQKMPSGGLSQTAKGGITITGVKGSAPFTSRFNWSLDTLKGGAKKAVRGGGAAIAASLALDYVLDQIGALIDEGGNVVRVDNTALDLPDDVISDADYSRTPDGFGHYYRSKSDSLSRYNRSKSIPNTAVVNEIPHSSPASFFPFVQVCSLNFGERVLVSFNEGTNLCYYLSNAPEPVLLPPTPVPESDINGAIDEHFSPVPDDFDWLSPYMQPDTLSIDTPILGLGGEPEVTTVYDADGNPHKVVETNIWHDFDVRDNDTSEPKIDVETTEETKTFENGEQTGSSTTTTTKPADEASPNTDTSTGGGGSSVEFPEIPTDCDFHPTLCAWMDWTKEDNLDDEPDLSLIMHEFQPENTDFTMSGAKTCPAPYSIHLGLINKTVELSFEPACTFAGYLYFFVMAGAYVFAAYITLGVVRNG